MDMHFSQIDTATGTPTNIWVFEGSIPGGKPSMSVMHRFADNTNMALGFGFRGTMRLAAPGPDGSVQTLNNTLGSRSRACPPARCARAV